LQCGSLFACGTYVPPTMVQNIKIFFNKL
jgi:hypothetical protein